MKRGAPTEPPDVAAPWSLEPLAALQRLGSAATGLTTAQAAERLLRDGRNELRARRPPTRLGTLLRQLESPLSLLLVGAVAVSIAARDWLDGAIILAIVSASAGIGTSREWRAQRAALLLQDRARSRVDVFRDGRPTTLLAEGLVRGDVVLLRAGKLIPADALLLEASDFQVNEALLTGESWPAVKQRGPVPAETSLAQRTCCVFAGTNVRSGTATCVVFATGDGTEIGSLAARLTVRAPETEFDRGLRQFGLMLMVTMLVIIILVFGAHMVRGRPPIETLLFAIALAVGLSPELLPAILSVNLARGADEMARHGVLVRRLAAIENLGSMDILCTDKTGTLTLGVVDVEGAYDPNGVPDAGVLASAAIQAAFATGLPSPMDDAIKRALAADLASVTKRAEIPFDFIRKRASVVVQSPAGVRLITKGAVDPVVADCVRLADGRALDDEARARLATRHVAWSEQGLRAIAVATRDVPEAPAYGRSDETDLTLLGFLTFLDHPKPGARQAIEALAKLGVSVKVITGDAGAVTTHIAGLIGLPAPRILTGQQIDQMHDGALWNEAERTDLFVEVDPRQKERILLALKKTGHVVGFMGDGVNDALAMHSADASLSVEGAAEVAREAADFVLLEKDLDVVRRGIVSGRKTFANTLKYILTTTSANLGNMISMALASLYLPFLPLLAGQILLNNFLSDIPAFGMATDSVDADWIERPRRWDMAWIRRFMIQFGLLSSLFDILTFAGLLWIFHASIAVFRTGWFVESLLTELLVALVVRTRLPFWRSRPGTLLLGSTAVVVVVALVMPYLPLASLLGFVPLPAPLMLALGATAAAYVVAIELLKRWFYRATAPSELPAPSVR